MTVVISKNRWIDLDFQDLILITNTLRILVEVNFLLFWKMFHTKEWKANDT